MTVRRFYLVERDEAGLELPVTEDRAQPTCFTCPGCRALVLTTDAHAHRRWHERMGDGRGR